jgi:DNA-binding CsgD family transcriptional regulator
MISVIPTPRELECMRLAGAGRTNKQIGEAMGIKKETVHAHIGHVFDKFGCRHRTAAVMTCISRNYLWLEEIPE